MKRSHLLGVVAIAMWILSTVTTAPASAANPEFLPIKGVKLEGKSSKAIFETLAGTKVEGSGTAVKGEVSASKTVSNVIITFTGVKSSGFSCNSPGSPEGTIVTHELTGTLGYIAKPVVGISLRPTKAGDVFAEFDCAGGIVKNKVLGGLICEIGKTNVSTESFTLQCAGKAGDQLVKKLEGGEELVPLLSINGGKEESSSKQTTVVISTGTKAEIMA